MASAFSPILVAIVGTIWLSCCHYRPAIPEITILKVSNSTGVTVNVTLPARPATNGPVTIRK